MPKGKESNPKESQISRRQALRLITGVGAGLWWMASVGRLRADGSSASNPVFPLTPKQMLDESTLDLKVLKDQSYVCSFPSGANRRLRRVSVRYFSHQWKDGPWEGTVELLIPDDIPADRRGVVFFAPDGPVNIEEGVTLRRDLWERTAVEMGIVIASMPDAGRHLGEDGLHAVSDAFLIRAIQSGDLGWLPIYPFAALRARAATMIGKLTGVPVQSVVHMGFSISATHAWNWPTYDQRVKGLIATGDIGCIEDWFPLDGSLKNSPRPAYNFLSQAPKDIQQTAIRLHDPFYYGGRLHNVLLIDGTSDPFVAPLPLAKFFAALGEPKHLSVVPNYGHGCNSRRHVDLARMWLEHWLGNRPLTQVAFVEPPALVDGKLWVRARVQSQAQIGKVQFIYVTSAEPNFLRGLLLPDAPKQSYARAQWQSVPLMKSVTADGSGEWSASVELPAGQAGKLFVAGYADVEDCHDGWAGYASTAVHWLELH